MPTPPRTQLAGCSRFHPLFRSFLHASAARQVVAAALSPNRWRRLFGVACVLNAGGAHGGLDVLIGLGAAPAPEPRSLAAGADAPALAAAKCVHARANLINFLWSGQFDYFCDSRF